MAGVEILKHTKNVQLTIVAYLWFVSLLIFILTTPITSIKQTTKW